AQLGGEHHHLQKIVDAQSGLGRDFADNGFAAPLLGHQFIFRELNEIDPDNASNHAIKVTGAGTQNGYRYTFAVPEDNEFKLEWRMKYSESYTVYISCTTTAGHRYIYYTASSTDALGTAEYVHHGLGTATKDGKWHTIRRDLVKDLHDAQPDVEILKVNAFLVRGSGYIDDIKTYIYADADKDLIPDGIETAAGLNPNDASDAKGDLDGDGLTNIEEFMLGTNIANADSDGDGLSDSYEINNGFNPLDGTDASLDSDGDGLTNLQELALGMDPNKAAVDENGYKYEFTVQEDGEDGATTNWVVYDADPAGATITNEIDFDNVSNHVIKLAGTGTQNGYRYTFAVPEDNEFKLEWKMKYSESYTVYISCTTTAGHRYIYYTASVADSLGTAEYVHHGLGTATKDGKWHTIRRDLVKDLHDAQADVEILKVNAFLVRGSGYIDDIKTYMYADADRDLIPDGIETAAGLNPNDASDAKGDLDGDGITNIEEFMLGVNIANADTDGDGVNDAVETANELDPNNPNDPGALVLSVTFPLESETIR
ncbi:MAG: hypothetical protein PHT81_07250, partial [Endomicrobiaceae bacterium]|nr:hypothetical protein [Endomicrobiaceae bacterium]